MCKVGQLVFYKSVSRGVLYGIIYDRRGGINDIYWNDGGCSWFNDTEIKRLEKDGILELIQD